MKNSLLVLAMVLLSAGMVLAQNNPSNPPTFQCGGTVSDYDGYVYSTIEMAGFCWMQENLRVTHYASGTFIPNASVYHYGSLNDQESNLNTYGRLYTWYSAVNVPENSTVEPTADEYGYVRGVCPKGWHIPTEAEMSALRALNAEDLRSMQLWLHSQNNTNSTGFTALPAGQYTAANERYEYLLARTGFWSVDGGTLIGGDMDATQLIYNCDAPQVAPFSKSDALSVRCVFGGSNSSTATTPTITTASTVSSVTSSSATVNSTVTSDGGAAVTARGVCWGTSHNPTLSGNHTSDGAGVGGFNSNLTGLNPNTTYYVRPYATNSEGTTYGPETSFTTPCWTVNVSISGETELCAGQSTILTASGAESYVWNTTPETAGNTLTVSTSGTYRVTGTDQYGCTGSANKTVTVSNCATVPTITTASTVSGVTSGSATVSSTVASDGGAAVTARGVCWGTSHNPTLSGNHTSDGAGIGSFNSNLTGLNPNTTYYVRPYATNSEGTTYGPEASFTTPCWTVNVSITGEAEFCAGESTTLEASGAESYVWNTTPETTGSTLTVSASGTYRVMGTDQYGCSGSASKTVTVHTPQNGSETVSICPEVLPYSWRGEVCLAAGVYTNSHTDANGCLQVDTLHLVVENCAVVPTVTVTVEEDDVDPTTATVTGNVTDDGGAPVTSYGFCWGTEENPDLAGEHTTNIAGEGGFSGSFTGTLTGLHPNTVYYVRSYATNSAGTSYGFGSWFRTPCWTVTVSISGESDICAGSSTTLVASGADAYSWRRGTTSSDIIGTDPTLTVSVGGTYIVTGYDQYYCPGHFHKDVMVHTPHHGSVNVSVCESDLPYTWHEVEYSAAGLYTYPHTNTYGCEEVDTLHLAVRNCAMPIVSTESVADVSSTSATLNGIISNPDNMTIISQGFEWKAAVGGTYTQVFVTGTTISYLLTNLTESTEYTFRAFVTTKSGTIYGVERTFSTTSPIIAPVACEVPASHPAQTSNVFEGNGFDGANHGLETVTNDGKINSVTDYDGNEYPVVQIGSQCWLAENMRCTHSPSTGTYIVNNEFTTGKNVAYTHTGKMARWYNNDSIAYAAKHYGLLYNWNAAVDVYNTTYGELSINTNSNYALSTTFTGTRQGICPVGWHVPRDAEWTTMTNYVSSNIDNRCDNNDMYIAKTLVATTDWDTSTVTCTIGNIPESNNAIGFTAFPAGFFSSEFYSMGNGVGFWSAKQYQNYKYLAFVCSMFYNNASVDLSSGTKSFGYSVRCIRDAIAATVPTVTTTSPTEITTTSVRLHGSFSNPDNVDIVAKGFQWKTTTGGSYMQTTVSGETMGYVLTGLTANTSYTYRAFVTSSFGNIYGSEVTFITDSIPAPVISTFPCNTTSTHPAQTGGNYQDNGFNGADHGMETVTSEGKINSVTDYDGNEYPVVQIGSQCWLAENMRCTHSPSTGTYIISNSTSGSFSGKMAKWYDNDELTCLAKKFGVLYNWNAAFDTFNTAYAYETNVSTYSSDAFLVDVIGNRQGICPVGWHLPTDAEWTALENTMYGGNVSGITSDYRGNCAGRLSSGDDWNNSSNANTPGNYSNPNRNSSAFGAVSAGEYYLSYRESVRVGSFGSSGQRTYFWSSSQRSDDAAYYRELYYDAQGVRRYFSLKYNALSVRCLRDEIGGEHGLSAPTVTTSAINNNNVTAVSAKCEGSIISDGGTTVLAYGVCWNTTGEPTNTDNNQTYQGNVADFSFLLTGLEANTTYYVRTFAINAVGVGYGEVRSFTTGGQPCSGVSSVRDYDGNVYYTVKIGEQCWMRENLHVSHFADGSIIGVGSSGNTTARGYYPNNNSYNASQYGLLYNWDAVIHSIDGNMAESSFVQGACPTGWHVPSDTEWTQLTDYLIAQSSYKCGSDNTSIAKALAFTSGWNSYSGACSVGNSQTNNNATGFSARPAGRYYGSYDSFGQNAIFWSSTGSSGTASVTRSIYYGSATVGRSETNMSGSCFSVRCLCDDPSCGGMTETLVIEIREVSDVTASTATIRSMISSDGGYEIYESGVCWSTAHNPTIEDSKTYDGMGTGAFRSDITGLTPATKYYVRPYVINDLGTMYGDEVEFTTCGMNFVAISGAEPVHIGESVTLIADGALEYRWSTGETTPSIVVIPSTNRFYSVVGVDQDGCKDSVSIALEIIVPEGDAQPCPSTPTVTDIDNNTYATVQIGTQCWMAQNLRTTHFPDGSSISLGGNNSSSTYTAYYYNNTSSTLPLNSRGYLYNWPAVMKGASSSNNIPSGVQGICPNGWHLPSDSEWVVLSDYVSSQSTYRCGNVSNYIAKALASETGWGSSTNGECCVGNSSQHVNNLTGFDAFPTGNRHGSSFYSYNNYAYFWSSSQDEDNTGSAWTRIISSQNSNLNRSATSKEYGLAVRCLRDEISIKTAAAMSISQTTATLNGIITNPDNVTINAQGFEWKATNSTAYTVVLASGITMSSNLSGLIPNTSYTYHAFMTTEDGTYYGDDYVFITADTPKLSPCSPSTSHPAQVGSVYQGSGFNGANHGLEAVDESGRILTVTDYDGNEYPVVQIGSQCWMAENMRSTRYSDGTAIPYGGSTSSGSYPYYYDNTSNSYILQLRGYYYNWPAAMHITSSSSDYSSTQGICPVGWHVPSRWEWESLGSYVNQQSEYYCSETYHAIAKALASVTGWNLSTETCAVGNSPENNNATGFAAIPVGYGNVSFSAEGSFAVFWSSTTVQYQGASKQYWYFGLDYNEPTTSQGSGSNSHLGRSVRCLRD